MEPITEDFSSVVVAIATVIYTLGTFLLWLANKESVDLLKRQLLLLEVQVTRQDAFNKALISNAALDSHREIWLPIISNPSLVNLLQSNNPSIAEKTIAEFLGSILINHCARIHFSFHYGFSNADEFASFSRDARYLFNFPLVRWRWEGVSKYHSPDFVKFIHDNVIS